MVPQLKITRGRESRPRWSGRSTGKHQAGPKKKKKKNPLSKTNERLRIL